VLASASAAGVRLHFVRHGETEWNARGVLQGWVDTPLGSRGREQAAAVGRRLARMPVERILASELRRARETAEVISGYLGGAVEIRCHAELREINYGSLQGRRVEEVADPNLQGHLRRLLLGLTLEGAPDGESVADAYARVTAFLRVVHGDLPDVPGVDDGVLSTDAAAPARNVVIVAHGGTIRLALCYYLGLSLHYWRRIRQDPAAVSVVRATGSAVEVEVVNDISHLGHERAP
jgi:broad specificity phosphatase PhoE